MITTAKRLETVQEYYFSKKLREVRALIAAGKPIINMGIGSPDLDPDPSVVKAIQQAVVTPKAHQYQGYQGIPELRAAIADFYKVHYKVSLSAEDQILPLMGSKEGIMHISMAFLNEQDQVLIPNPGYPTYASVTKLVGATPIFYDLKASDNWAPDLEALEKQDLSKVKLMWLNYPNMPTGAKGSLKVLEDVVAFAKKHQILVINDNPYSFILNDAPTSILSIPGAKQVALELNSLSKTFNMAGWRVGMLCGDAKYLQEVLKVKSNMDSGMFYGIQKGAVAALNLSKDWFTSLNAIYAVRRERIYQLADMLGCSYDTTSVGMFVWAKLPDNSLDAEAYIDKILYEKDVFITPGTIFGSNGAGYIRFSLCVDVATIEEVISRFKNA